MLLLPLRSSIMLAKADDHLYPSAREDEPIFFSVRARDGARDRGIIRCRYVYTRTH